MPDLLQDRNDTGDFRVRGSVLLFSTVQALAKEPNGLDRGSCMWEIVRRVIEHVYGSKPPLLRGIKIHVKTTVTIVVGEKGETSECDCRLRNACVSFGVGS